MGFYAWLVVNFFCNRIGVLISTYVDHLVNGVRLLMGAIPRSSTNVEDNSNFPDNVSHVAPFRVVNIGSSNPIKLLDFISAIEKFVGAKAIKNYLPMQAGDVLVTWSDTSLLEELTGYKPITKLTDGIQKFVGRYQEYYNV